MAEKSLPHYFFAHNLHMSPVCRPLGHRGEYRSGTYFRVAPQSRLLTELPRQSAFLNNGTPLI
jgi:hypothetical protein